PEAPSFANTLAPLENSGRELRRVLALFGVMTNNLNTPAYQALDREWSPILAAASDEIIFDEDLFDRIEAVYEGRENANLSAEQLRVLERTYERFVRGGARLDEQQKAELGRINQRLAGLFSDFANKVLADENSLTAIDSEEALSGVPASLRASY